MNNKELQICLQQAEKIATACQNFPDHRPIQTLARRLSESAIFCNESNQNKPLTISLAGGTGVGKSFIFSALAGIPGLSPSSASVRGFTRRPHIAAEDKFKPFVPFEPQEVEFVQAFLPATVLIDTPDLDTINSDNVRLAKHSLEISDIIIFVTSPDKRSDFTIQQNILEWGNRKRWFFVMNKIDQVTDAPVETLKTDFFKRIKSLGFMPEDSFVFLLSARDPDSEEFNRFRNALSASHPIKLSRILFEETCYRSLLHAINCDTEISELSQLLGDMKNFQHVLMQRIHDAHRLVIESEQFKQITYNILMHRVFSSIASSRTLFLSPYFILINYFRGNDHLTKLQEFLKAIFADNTSLTHPFRDEARFLQENHLLPFSSIIIHQPSSNNSSEIILKQIETAALKSQKSKFTTLYLAAGNILPVIILLQALYRSVFSWITGVWLPSDFFIHAAFLIVGSTLPGYLLISTYLRRFCDNRSYTISEKDCQQMVDLDEKTAVLEAILHDSSLLSSECNMAIKKLNTELPSGIYGSSTEL